MTVADKDEARVWLIDHVADSVTVDKFLANPDVVLRALGADDIDGGALGLTGRWWVRRKEL